MVSKGEPQLLPAVLYLPCHLRYSVENAFLEEKEDACNALAEIAENVG